MTTAPAVLINVDDHEVARYARTRILRAAGFTVYDAANGMETLALAEVHHPDLILLDVHLPDVGGVEVCRRLKLQFGDTPIIVLQISASALSPAHAKESLDAGADSYLMEPVDPDVLVATVRALLRLHRAERLLTEANQRLESSNRELERSNQDLQQFAYAASHDLQEPLRNIGTFAQLLEHGLDGKISEQQRGYIQRIVDGAQRMRRLVSDLLAYSQVGREGRSGSPVDLNEVVNTAILDLSESIKEVGGQITMTNALPIVAGDSSHFLSLFHNLFSNCLKYREPERALLVEIDAEKMAGREWKIRVADNGIGVPQDYHQLIFEPFKRLHGAGIPGTGIGLALCRRIVEVSGGRIWVEDAAGAGGAVFCFTIPGQASGG